jgi:NAD(P)-dependent dehydrogenase (short-subunit alcohol dehydrogenase family)
VIVEVAMDPRDRVALVTGAGRGLGAELARELAAAGATVVLVARSEAELADVEHSIRAAGGRAHALRADVGDPRAAARVAGAAAAMAGPVDILVHNASTLGPVPLRPLLDTEPADFDQVLQVNVSGPFRLSRHVVGSMVLRRRGVVVHVSSDAAVEAYPRWGAYSVSKAALDHLARLQAAELEGTGVRVFAVDPGEMRTRMHADAVPDADPATLIHPREVAGRILELIRDDGRAPSGSRVSAAVPLAVS